MQSEIKRSKGLFGQFAQKSSIFLADGRSFLSVQPMLAWGMAK
jgi:hypothetical protein